jgi:UDP-glucose 4-epimerase
LNIFGGDYDTIDGTGVRDYIHVCDLADAHVAALNALVKGDKYPKVYNVGTGHGVSVLNLVKVFSDVTGVEVPYQIVGRRDGDVATSYCDVTKIHEELGWWATRDIQDMCKDAWNWAVKHPNGYED